MGYARNTTTLGLHNRKVSGQQQLHFVRFFSTAFSPAEAFVDTSFSGPNSQPVQIATDPLQLKDLCQAYSSAESDLRFSL